MEEPSYKGEPYHYIGNSLIAIPLYSCTITAALCSCSYSSGALCYYICLHSVPDSRPADRMLVLSPTDGGQDLLKLFQLNRWKHDIAIIAHIVNAENCTAGDPCSGFAVALWTLFGWGLPTVVVCFSSSLPAFVF